MVLYLSNTLIIKTLSAPIISLIPSEILILLSKIMQNNSYCRMVFQKDYNPISCSDFKTQLKIVQLLVNNLRGNMEDFNK
jgi:hypothetical protein